MRHIHLIGICGTFMAGIASLAKAMGYRVTGSDEGVYPPMSTMLDDLGIEYFQGFDAKHLNPAPDVVLVGNATKRGNPEFEYALSHRMAYQSAPEWLYQHIMRDRVIFAVAGTHGKTTTSAMLAHALRKLGQDPGFLIGGLPQGFEASAHLGQQYFVIEADEYDTALFDKRSKFLHYHPDFLALNNLEFDHADIFRDLEDVKRQFHHLLKTLSQDALVAYNAADDNLQSVLAQGCWSKTQGFSTQDGLQAIPIAPDFSAFEVRDKGEEIATIHWSLIGEHNAQNALAVCTLLIASGFEAKAIATALETFKGVKRRMEMLSEKNGVTIYNDFAHHPTAIKTTLKALRAKVGAGRIIAVLQFGSYTMREGVHAPSAFVDALSAADDVIVKSNAQNQAVLGALKSHFADRLFASDAVADIAAKIHGEAKSGDTVLIMSNSSFDGLYNLL